VSNTGYNTLNNCNHNKMNKVENNDDDIYDSSVMTGKLVETVQPAG